MVPGDKRPGEEAAGTSEVEREHKKLTWKEGHPGKLLLDLKS